MKDIRQKAIAFATKAHEGQIRKGNGEPYVNHPIRVADDVLSWPLPDNLITLSLSTTDIAFVSGVLHDTIEDCDVTYEDIANEFSVEIAEIVKLLTRPPKQTYFSFIQKISNTRTFVGTIALFVKLSDINDNMADLREGSLKDKYRFAEQVLLSKII